MDGGLFVDRAGFQNFIGDAEYFLGALFGDWFSICPSLDVAATKLASFEAESFAAKKSYSFSFNFAKVFWCSFVVVEIIFQGVSDRDVGHFMEKSLMWELGHRVDGYLAPACVTLAISVRAGEWDVRDVEAAEGLLSIPGGEVWQFNVLAFRL